MRNSVVVAPALLGAILLMSACDDSDPTPPVVDESASCVGCHTDYELLEQIATPDSVIPTGGCGGPPPYIEPHDRVFMGGDGFAEFQNSPHGELECIACHNGVDSTSDKTLAHSGDFTASPTHENLDAACAQCHSEIVDNFEHSLHFGGWGQKRSQAIRFGVDSFDELPQAMQHGYEQNCATCHASCGECHVNKPKAIGGGLADGHAFHPPDMRENCTACHSSRGGHAYYGEGTGTQPDVHLTEAGFTCMECHDTHELHNMGGSEVDQRYAMPDLPECEDCHTDLRTQNTYHRVHLTDMNCHTCHSQDYNTCGSCHVGGEGARVHSHQSFKIALNPIPDLKPHKFATVRRTPAAPDSWSVFGIETLDNFDAKPTFNYTTPHNILRWTTRTEVAEGESCYANCHIIAEEDGTLRNRHLYLFESDFGVDWMIRPNQEIFVDGHLPDDWGLPQ